VALCGRYFFDFGDRMTVPVAIEPLGNVLLIRNHESYDYLLSRRIGERLELVLEKVDPCVDPRGNQAACLQGRSNAYVVVRELEDHESCVDRISQKRLG
jgi:hypothetical protein